MLPNEGSSKDVFTWSDRGRNYKLRVLLDAQQPANTTVESSNPNSTETVIGTAIGTLIGNLISGGSSTSSSSHPAAGTPVNPLRDLVGARAGQAENTVIQRGYQFLKGAGGGFSYWRETRTGYCVTIRTNNGRYASIGYATPIDCQ